MGRPTFCTFGPTLTSRFPLRMAQIKKGEEWCGNTSDLGLSKYAKIKALSPFLFWGENTITLCIIWTILEESRAGRQIRESESNFDISFLTHATPGTLPVKTFCFQHFPVLLLPITKDVSERFDLDFQVCMLFLVQGLHF